MNPIRNYIEKVLPTLDFKPYEATRPKDVINLSLGDPTLFSDFATNPEVIKLCQESVGKVDGYTDMKGLEEIRDFLV